MHQKSSNTEKPTWKLIMEILFAEMILFFLLWFWDEYIALLITLIVVCLSAVILILSLIMEGIERSKVPRFYFVAVAVTIVAPLIVMAIFSF